MKNTMFVNKNHLKVACLKNAKNLLKESLRLDKRRKYALATFFAITSFEESQKLGLLSMLEAKYLTENEFLKYWYRHEDKIRSSQARIRFNLDSKVPNEKPKVILGSLEEAKEITKIRENCLYVDFSDKDICQPKDINVAVASRFINDARQELRMAETLEVLARKLRGHFSKRGSR